MRDITRGLMATVLAFLGAVAPAAAHPAPFSYIDVRLQPDSLDLTLVVHVFDIAHEFDIEPVDGVLDPAVLNQHAQAIAAMLGDRLRIGIDGGALAGAVWSAPEPLAERQSLRVHARYPMTHPPGVITVAAALFPYDPGHQTFVNVYEGDALITQAILDKDRTRLDHMTGTRQGIRAVAQRFTAAGVHHILIGPDHIMFLIGLLLLGGSIRRLIVMVSAFTLAHSITLSLAALNIVDPPSSVVEPAIALSIVCVGVDNLVVRGGRDLRAWMAFAFGFVHGFGFAGVLREVGLESRALVWSLLSFNLGVEVGQLLVVVAVASAFAMLRATSETAGRRLAFAGSLGVIAAGTFWFIERVLSSGGMT